MRKKQLIGLIGEIGAGKSTISAHALAYLQTVYGLTGQRIGFMDAAYKMLIALGVPAKDVYDKSKWDEPTPLNSPLCGRTIRQACQTLGTEWGCNLVHAEIWVNSALGLCHQAFATGVDLVILDNVRKWPEFNAVKTRGGFLIAVCPLPSSGSTDPKSSFYHESEALIPDLKLKADYTLFNDKRRQSAQEVGRELAGLISATYSSHVPV